MKKLFLTVLSICTLFVYVPIYADEDPENKEFTKFMDQEFIDTMESDYLTMHYSVKDYKSLGIEKPDREFGDASLESYKEAVQTNQEALSKLKSFDYNTLSINQQHDYDTYKKALEDSIALNSYPLFDACFNPYTGILDNIVTNLTEFAFYEKEDFEDYLDVLSSVSDYLEDAIELTKYQASNGYFLSDSLLDEAKEWISDFTNKKDNNALICVFDESVDAFDGLTDAEKENYKKENKEIVLNDVLPAYDNVSVELEKLRGSAKYEGSLANYPNGKAYYQALVQSKTSTNETIDELIAECEDYISSLIDIYIVLYSMDQDIDTKYDQSDFSIGSVEDTLAYLQEHMSEYPKGPDVTYICSYLDESVANDSILAYYLNPPMDDYKHNVIRINGETVGEDDLQLYGTLALEGFPGHLYQTTWYYATNPHPIRTVTSMIGYTEGWAMYAECDEYLNSPESYEVGQYAFFDTALGYAINAYADLGVNGEGWTSEELNNKLNDIGLNGDALAEPLFDFVIERAGQILPYGIGMMKFHKLRGKTSEALGEKFNETTFDTILLTYGPRPFETVENDIDNFITLKGFEVPEEYDNLYDYLNTLINRQESTSDPNYIDSTIREDKKTDWKTYAVIGGAVVLAGLIVFIVRAKKKEGE